MKITRRTFLKDAGLVVGILGLSQSAVPQVAEALELLASGRAPVLWLQGQACSGCSISLLNSESPSPADLLTRYLSLYFHHTLSAATGVAARKVLEQSIADERTVLVVEGSVPAGMPKACTLGDETFNELLIRAAKGAQAVVCVGACASFGGIPAAQGNPTGALDVPTFLQQAGIEKPVINLPGCPTHPAWSVGTILHLLRGSLPELDELHRPKAYYNELLHDQCPLFAKYQIQEFARLPGEDGCLFKLGCQGAITKADCSMRGWNGGVNWCVRTRGVCVGCARPEFARDRDYPFYRIHESATNGPRDKES